MTTNNTNHQGGAGPRPEDGRERGEAQPAEERIAKVIARAGVASRRDAEAMIAEGLVMLNGEVLASPAVNVAPADRNCSEPYLFAFVDSV